MSTPVGETILLYWENRNRSEEGQIILTEDMKGFTHILFDGERLNDEPTHRMYIPEAVHNDI
jgi:hypothetical protein